MASRRIGLRFAHSVIASTAAPLSQTARRCLQPRPSLVQATRHRRAHLAVAPLQKRWHSTEPPTKTKVYEFDEIQSFVSNPSSSRILIDVREPSEFGEGHIPGATNIPIKSAPDALFLPEQEFEDRFGFEKPSKDVEVVFYCRSGVRSSAAAQLAGQNGYQNISEYRGSWLDWEKKGGQKA